MGWSARLEPPMALPDGKTLMTLREAGDYIARLPAATQRRPEWQAATEALLLVAERNGPAMLARIGIMRAFNAGKPAPAIGRTRRAKVYRLIG